MAKLEIGSEGGTASLGSGPNQVTVKVDDHRAGITASTGLATRLQFASGRIHLGAGLTGSASVNTNPGPYVATGDHAANPGIATGRDAANLAVEVHRKTNGTMELRDVSLLSGFDAIGRYPVAVKQAIGERIAKVVRTINELKLGANDARGYLYDSLTKDGAFTDYPDLEPLLRPPVTWGKLDALSIRDLQQVTDRAMRGLKKFDDDTQLLTGPREPALAKIGDWVNGRDPRIKLTMEQKVAILDALHSVSKEVTAFQDLLAGTLSPQEMRKFYDKATTIARYDPQISVTGYAAGAYEQPVAGATVVAGAMVQQGVRYTIDSVYAARDDRGKLHMNFNGAEVAGRGIHVGAGSNAFNAMPLDAAEKLRIPPEAGFGGHVYAQEEKGKLLGATSRSSEVGVALKHSEGKGDKLTYVEAAVAHEKRPAETPGTAPTSGTKLKFVIGKTF